MANTKIEWTESTWNPVTGCTKLSSGCEHCYAERMATRLKNMGNSKYENGFRVTCHPSVLQLPMTWRTPKRIFVNSMGDLFHEDVPGLFIHDVFSVMKTASRHQFLLLTKRSQRLAEMANELEWADNIWMGVTVEDSNVKYRIDDLRKTPSIVRFLSIEPLLSSMGKLNLDNIHWVIVGGESGPNARPMEEKWVLEIKRQSDAAKVPFFFKQWGGVNKKQAGRTLLGKTWDSMPPEKMSRNLRVLTDL